MLSQNLTRVPILIRINNIRKFSTFSKFNISTKKTENIINIINSKPSIEIRNNTKLKSKEVERLIQDYENLKNNKYLGHSSTPGVNLSSIKPSNLVTEDIEQNVEVDNSSGIDNDLLDSNNSDDLDDNLSFGDRSIRRFKPLDLIALGQNLAIVLATENNQLLAMNFLGELQSLKPLNVRIHIPNPFINPYWLSNKRLLSPIEAFLDNPTRVEEFLPDCIELTKTLESLTRSFSLKNQFKLQSTWSEYYIRRGIQQIALEKLVGDLFKGTPNPIELLGAYRYFREEQLHYYFNPDDFNKLQFYSKDFVNRVTNIREKLDNNDTDILEFWKKAKIITNYSRSRFGKHYDLDLIGTWFKGYHPEANRFSTGDNNIREEDLPKLNEFDMEVVRLIQDFIRVDKFGLSHNLVPVVSSLLKPIGHYHYFYAPTANEFLRDLGVYKPIENLNFLHPNLSLNNTDNDEEFRIKDKSNIWDNIKDDCESIRKDFGDLPVYTVDSESANEIDDGISIDYKDPDNPSLGGWLRVHIADPTIVIDSVKNPIFKKVLNQPTTAYLPDQILPMLPSWLSYGKCSLGESNEFNFRYVMSFSIKFNKDGKLNFNQIEVIPGKVRNLVKISYNEVDKLMGIKISKDSLVTAYPPNLETKAEEVNKEVVKNYDDKLVLKDMKFIKNLIQGHRNERIKNGALVTFFPKPFIQVEGINHSRADIDNIESTQKYPNFNNFEDKPIIKYELDKSIQLELNSSSIVAECMILAGKISAKFSEINKLPSLYINQLPPDLKLLNTYEKSIYNKVINGQSESIDPSDFVTFRSLLTPATTSLKPKGHHLMGISGGYLRVTSPLRRFNDIINHIQFKNYLLGKDLIDKQDLLNMNELILAKNYRINLLKKSTEKFFTLELLNSIHNSIHKSDQLLNCDLIKILPESEGGNMEKREQIKKHLVLKCQIIKFEPKNNTWIIYLTDFGIFSTLKNVEFNDSLKIGEVKCVKLVQLIKDLNILEFELVDDNKTEEN